MIRAEHNDHCAEIADRLDRISQGMEFRCPCCGNECDDETAIPDTDNGVVICDNCGEEVEEVSMYDYLEEALEIMRTYNGAGELVGCEILVAFGGPNIYVDTRRKEVALYWWGERGSASLSSDACEALNYVVSEIYFM